MLNDEPGLCNNSNTAPSPTPTSRSGPAISISIYARRAWCLGEGNLWCTREQLGISSPVLRLPQACSSETRMPPPPPLEYAGHGGGEGLASASLSSSSPDSRIASPLCHTRLQPATKLEGRGKPDLALMPRMPRLGWVYSSFPAQAFSLRARGRHLPIPSLPASSPSPNLSPRRCPPQ